MENKTKTSRHKMIHEFKLHKTILFGFIVLLGLGMSACTKANKVRVKYINKTDSELKCLIIGSQRICKLDKNAETKYLPYKVYHFDSGLPDETTEAKIDGQKVNDYSQFYWCGTSKYAVEEGTFDIEIHKVVEQDKVYLYLVKI